MDETVLAQVAVRCGDRDTLDVRGIWGTHRLSSGTALDIKTETLGRVPDLGIIWKELKTQLVPVFVCSFIWLWFPRSSPSHLDNTVIKCKDEILKVSNRKLYILPIIFSFKLFMTLSFISVWRRIGHLPVVKGRFWSSQFLEGSDKVPTQFFASRGSTQLIFPVSCQNCHSVEKYFDAKCRNILPIQ